MSCLLSRLQRYAHDDPSGGSPPVWDGEVGWAALLDLARRHAVIPLLSYSIRTTQAQSVPSAGLAELQGLSEATMQHNQG